MITIIIFGVIFVITILFFGLIFVIAVFVLEGFPLVVRTLVRDVFCHLRS